MLLRDLPKIILFIPMIFSSCVHTSSSDADRTPIREAVMQDGMKIITMTKHGEFIVEAGSGTERSYTWDGETVKVNLVPRQERWHGTLGLLDGNDVDPPHKNVVHVVIEECQIHYNSLDDATKRLGTYEGIEDIYRDDGLFIRFTKQTSDNGEIFIDISIFQILINGEKPIKLPGSQNNKIKVQ